MIRIRLVAAVAVFSTVFIALVPASVLAKSTEWKGELPIRQAWLRDHLPADSFIYVRTPHLFGLFATPKGNSMDAALRSEVNVENVQNIRQGIIDNVLMHIPVYSDVRLRMFEEYVRSPIEIAAVMAPAPAVLISVNLALDSNADFDTFLNALGDENVAVGLAAPLDDRGVGELSGLPIPVFVRFDSNTGGLLINGGPAVTAEAFDGLLAGIDKGETHRMRVMENRIDQSGQGLFLWIDAAQALPAMQAFLPPEQLEIVNQLGLDKMSSAAIGWGVANGKGRIAIVADVPSGNDRGFLPLVSNNIDAKSVGDPDGLIVLSIPTKEEYLRLEALALESTTPELRQHWMDGRSAVAEKIGVPIEDFFAAIGPELLVIFDQAGDYAAVRLRDPRLWDSIVKSLSDSTSGNVDQRRISGKTYFHMSFPSDMGLLNDDSAENLGWFAILMHRQREHMYWVRDREFLYLASVPQPLIDRAAMRARVDIGEWLSEKQRIDTDDAILSLSGTSRKLPRRLYGLYTELLQLLADIALTDIDIWSMPTPAQLELPELGTLGFTISLGDPTLSAELTFENNPGEFLGGVGGVAMVGVVAAIAIPAYQDYTIRAKVSEGLNLSAGVKAGVTEYYFEHGQFPGSADVTALSINEDAGEYTESVIVEAGTGKIIIDFDAAEIPGGGQIVLEPEVLPDMYINWICSGSLPDKHLPAACRADQY